MGIEEPGVTRSEAGVPGEASIAPVPGTRTFPLIGRTLGGDKKPRTKEVDQVFFPSETAREGKAVLAAEEEEGREREEEKKKSGRSPTTSGAKTRTKRNEETGETSRKEKAEKAAASRWRAGDIVSQTFSTQSVGQSLRTGELGPLCSLRRPTLENVKRNNTTWRGSARVNHFSNRSAYARWDRVQYIRTYLRVRVEFDIQFKFRFVRKNVSMAKSV